MNSAPIINETAYYNELLDEKESLKQYHPAVRKMQVLSDQLNQPALTAIDKLEIYKECHRLADDLYRLTGSKKIVARVMSFGELLMNRPAAELDRSLL